MKLIHFINRPQIGGVQLHVLNELKMDLSDIDMQVLFQENFDDHQSGLDLFEASKVRYTIAPDFRGGPKPLYYFRLYKWVLNFLRTEKPDILVTHHPVAGYIGRLAARRAKVPVTVHIFHGHYFHSYFSKPVTESLRRLEKYLAKNTSQILTISPQLKKELTEDYKIAPDEKIAVLPIHIDLSDYSFPSAEEKQSQKQKWNMPSEAKVLTTVGRVIPVKNQKLFVDLVSELKSQGLEVRGILVGDGESISELQEYAKSKENLTVNICGIDGTKDFSFAGESTQIPQILQGSDLFVLTSLNEGTPLTIREAQASGLPVLSTDLGSVFTLLVPETSALVSEPTPLSMARAATELLDRVQSDQLQKRSQDIVDQFDLKRKAKQVSDIYTSL